MSAPPLPLRALDLLATLRSHRVEFVVIGGFSLAAHGYVRATKDVDIVPEPEPANLRRLWGALQDLDAAPMLGDIDAEELPVSFTADGLIEGGGNWVLQTRLGRLDVMQYVSGIHSYEQLAQGAVVPDLPGMDDPPAFAGRDDLIAMKHAAGRPLDLQDISALERTGAS